MAIGVSYERFMDSCPKELEPFVEAEKLRLKRQDEDMWVMGIYVQSAVSVAVEHCLAGRKAKSRYFDKPISRNMEKNNNTGQEEVAVFEMKQRIKMLKNQGLPESPI